MSKRLWIGHFICAVTGGIMIAGAASCASRQASVGAQEAQEIRDRPKSRDIKPPAYLPPEDNDVELDVIDIELHAVESPDGSIRFYYTFKYNPDSPSDPCLSRITGAVTNLVERKTTDRFCGSSPDQEVIEHIQVREGSVSRNDEFR